MTFLKPILFIAAGVVALVVLTFALLLGGAFAQSTGYALREQMASDIAAYPAVGDAATLVPGPFAPIPARACRVSGAAC